MSRQPTKVSAIESVWPAAGVIAGFGVVLLGLFPFALPIVVLVTVLALPLLVPVLVLAIVGGVLAAPIVLWRRHRTATATPIRPREPLAPREPGRPRPGNTSVGSPAHWAGS
jgi:hypothetical protein